MIRGALVRSPEAWNRGVWEEGATGEEGRHGHVHVLADAGLDDREVLAGKLGIEAALFSDPELIAAAWLRWGEDCCEHLLGDFAFVLWDSSRRVAMLARDAVGVRPLHYYIAPDRIVFDSDLDRLLAVAGVPHLLDESVLAARLLRPRMFMPVLNQRTCWKEVRKLPPGHRLVISDNAIKCDRWRLWEQTRDVRFKRREDYAEALAERLGRAVERCLKKPGKVASHLSGGWDCSSLAVLAARQLHAHGRQLAAGYTWFAPPDTSNPRGDDTYSLAANLAQELAVPLHAVTLTPESLAALAAADFTRRSVHMLEYENEVLRHAGRMGVKVILSGWGGDDVATTRHWGGWFDLLHQGRWIEAWSEFRLGAAPAPNFPRAVGTWLYNGRCRRDSTNDLPRKRQLEGYIPMPFINAAFSRRTITDPVFAPLSLPHPARGLRAHYITNLTAGHLALRMESWAIAGAAHGIRYRFPMLDRELLEFCLGIPSEQTILGGVQRSLFRCAVKGVLPEAIRLQKKPKEPQRVARLGAANDAATELLAGQARSTPLRRRFDWIDYGVLQRVLAEPAEDPQSRFVRRQAARIAVLSASW